MKKKFKKNRQIYFLILLACIIPITTIAFSYGVWKTANPEVTISRGIAGDTVYIDDLDSDYYYYLGQNYTNSTDGSLPTLANKKIYGDNNLVKTTVVYHGTSIDGTHTGYVSLTEKQSKFVYYKYYPKQNGTIEIELIDNPFADHPNNLAFNGWVTDYQGAKISYDDNYYKRYVNVPVGNMSEIEIHLYASWTEATVAYVNGGTSFDSAQTQLKTTGMNEISTVNYIYEYPEVAGYYKGATITTTATKNTVFGSPEISYGTCTDCYDENTTYHSSYQCPAPSFSFFETGTKTNTCNVYYLQDENDEYQLGSTYYEIRNRQFVDANLQPTIIGTEDSDLFNENSNMAGYYRQVQIPYNGSITGYYNQDGTLQSGACGTRNGCTVYQLIQFYKADGTEEKLNADTTYYYLVTRDTNILVMTGNMASTWGESSTKPFTLTGIYNGVDYNPTWNVNNLSVTAYADTRIENLTISTSVSHQESDPSSSNSANATFYGNYFNVKLGRNIKQNGNRVNFTSVLGGRNSSSSWGSSSTVGSASSPKKYQLIIESGDYNSVSLTMGSSTGTNGTQLYTEMYGIYGNDYDRATENNENLLVYFCASGAWGGRIYSSNDNLIPALNTIIKSGSFGTHDIDHTSGIYVGGRQGGTHYAPRSAKMEGGYVANLIGGPLTASSKGSTNDIYIYMTGGQADTITGGAGTSTTYGNRIVQITGGTVNYSVFGGSNGYNGSSSDGTLTGDSYVYIGGTATIGNDAYISNNQTIWGAEAGSVFGSGNGNSRYATIGSVNHSNIVVADQAVVKRNVYGSGNYGTVGYSATNSSSTSIQLVGGTVNGSVFGSGNHSGSGRRDTVTSNIEITMDGGHVLDSIYGGSNQEGTVYGNSNINLINGELKDAYGGGLGEETYISRNVVINIGNSTTSNLNITGAVYGGSAFGVVNSETKNNVQSSYTTKVNVNAGNISQVFGGGKGNTSITPYVAGDVTVTMTGGQVGNLFGGNDAKGEPNGEVVVNLNGGTVTNAYGGGNNTLVTSTHVYQNNSVVENLFGGSNQSGNVTDSNLTIAGGKTTNAYGGNNVGGRTASTYITVTSGEIQTLYGGGKLTDTGTSTIEIKNGSIQTVYGGGEQANMENASNLTVENGTIGDLYGGSNILGNVPTSNVQILGGTLTNVYGGNNQGGITSKTNVMLKNGSITNAYGGGNKTSTTDANVSLEGATIGTIYGGGNQAGVTTTNVDLKSGQAEYIFGGSNQEGTVDKANVKAENPNNLAVSNVYGGNNQGGITKDANIILNGGVYTNLYGGGNMAPTDTTNVKVTGIEMNGEFFGGGNQAAVNYDTKVVFKNSSIAGDLFGGGNLGIVSGDTDVDVTNSHISSSIYAGGNGTTAVVYGSTTLDVDQNTIVDQHVFGGGNAANTGTKETNQSVSHVNIKGASIHGNVYGGANTAVLYGTVELNIGLKEESANSSIMIDGTVFGGGEANAEGDPNYDYSFISVTKGISISIDGEGYDQFYIKGSIFGSGNASSTEGYSYIDISNYGTFDQYQENISIQRADVVTMKNSAIKLEGTTDRTNEFSTTKFSISRVKELKLANGSTLFLDNGTNLLEKLSSLKIDGEEEAKATVAIAEDGSVKRNVDNRIYMLEGKNMNIATNEAVTSYGEVSGMTFFGMYQLDRNDRVLTAFYHQKYDAGDTVASGEFYAFTSGSYALGLHNTNHDITKDGFYSNYENEEVEGTVEVKYIEPTPSDASYYMWVIGETVETYELTLTASKYATLGTYELPLVTSSGANTKFEILGFNYQNLEEGFQLVDPNDIERVNRDGTADDVMGLSMEASNTGFVTKGSTNFRTDEGTSVIGTTSYQAENSSAVPSFIFYLYHSKNLTKSREIGTVVISLLEITPIDELNNEVTRVNINVTINSALYSNNEYEGAMTSGEKYDLFATTQTNITTKSTLSAYYSLYMETDKPYYQSGYQHALVSNYILPKGTKVTMIDLATTPTYYYHVIDDADVEKAEAEYALYGESSYYLSDFIAMGSTSSGNNYNEEKNMELYYDQDLGIIQEEFIFIVDFGDTEISGDQIGKSLLMELRNAQDQTLISVLGIQHANLTYNLYDNQDAVIDIEGNLSKNPIYVGEETELELTTNFIQSSASGATVVDTTYLDKRLGIYITIFDSNNNQLNNSSLLGLTYELDGVTYYPRMDGSIRIPLADKVANVLSRIKIHTNNVNLASGKYTMKIESFGSPDGIYFGTTSSDQLMIPFEIINSRYGLDVSLDEKQSIVNKETGYTMMDNNVLTFHVKYSSNLANPNIRVSLFRRNYDQIYDTAYTQVNLLDYITNSLPMKNENEYLLAEMPAAESDKFLYLKSNLKSGTYRFVFRLYDGDTFIGDCMEYVIIK